MRSMFFSYDFVPNCTSSTASCGPSDPPPLHLAIAMDYNHNSDFAALEGSINQMIFCVSLGKKNLTRISEMY